MNGPSDTEVPALRAEVAQLRAELEEARARSERLAADLGASRAMQTATIESLPFDFWARDRDGRCVSQNHAARARWGDTVGTRPEEMDLPSDVIATWLECNRRALSGEIVRGDVTYVVGDDTRHVHNIVAPIRRGDEIVGTLGVNIDLTELRRAEAERVRLERRLRETERLETLGLLAGGVAHDMNNIVMVVLATTSLARRHATPESSLDHDLETIETASRRAAALCSQLLAVAGKGRLTFEAHDLSLLAADTASLVKTTLPPNVELWLTRSGAEDIAAEVDVTQMRQLVMNLVLNASEAIGPRPGRIEIRVSRADASQVRTLAVRNVALEIDLSREYVMLEVADTGAGIDAETRARMFDPFFSTKALGRGLGLAAALGTVRAHHGGLDVETVVGVGSTFRVLLPRAVRAIERPKRNATVHWRGSGLALVVDDDANVAKAAARILEAIGFEAIVANGGQAALVVVAERPNLALVLLDSMMPGLDGATTLVRIRAARPSLPVVLMSGFDDLAERPPDTKLLHKPFTVDELSRTIRDAVAAHALR